MSFIKCRCNYWRKNWKCWYSRRPLPLLNAFIRWTRKKNCSTNTLAFVKKNRKKQTYHSKFANSPFDDCELYETKKQYFFLLLLLPLLLLLLLLPVPFSFCSEIPTLSDTWWSALYTLTHRFVFIFLDWCVSLFCRIFRFCCRFFGLRHKYTHTHDSFDANIHTDTH